jgi:hypothetical protein
MGGLRLRVWALRFLFLRPAGDQRPAAAAASCALRDQRGQRRRYWPPFAPWVLGPVRSWNGLGVVWGAKLGPWAAWRLVLGSVVGGPDRHRGWLFCPSSVPAAAGRGLRPRVFSAHGPGPQLQVQDSVMGRRPVVGIAYIQTGSAFLLQAIFTIWPGLVPIQTGAPA